MSGYRELLPGEKIRVAFLFQIASFWPAWESLDYLLLHDNRFKCAERIVDDLANSIKETEQKKDTTHCAFWDGLYLSADDAGYHIPQRVFDCRSVG